MTIKQILENKKEVAVSLSGWVISNRGNNNIRFIILNDGSTFDSIQVVVKDEDAIKMDEARTGAAIKVSGEVKLTPEAKQPLELIAKEITILKNTDEDYPLQKQGMSREVLREIPHLRNRTNLFRAVMRVRSTLTQEMHAFFAEENFLNAASPIITGNDGEGAGEAFVVDDEEGNFFGKKATLGVTGQLHAEAYANGFGNVYTFAPTFRAEKSHTMKHAAEFWMIEPEMAFTGQMEAIKFADKLLKTVIKRTLEKCQPEFKFLSEFVDKDIFTRLNRFLDKGVQVIDYKEAIDKLIQVKDMFDVKNIFFGLDLATEHEKYIADKLFGGPVAVINYPREIKAFYMKQNADNKTVACFDILVPGIGELVGGSERETDLEKLITRMKEVGVPIEDLQWYLDLRRFGQAQSAGFGIGFERLVMYVTGIENIRDAIPFPRTTNNLKM